LVIATILGSTGPVEIRKIAQLASMYESSQQYRCRYGNYTHSVLGKFVTSYDIADYPFRMRDLPHGEREERRRMDPILSAAGQLKSSANATGSPTQGTVP
jgi:hypothetical protein